MIRHAAKGDLDQPSPRIARHAFFRPLCSRRNQGLLHSVLGGGEVAKTADYCAEHLRRKIAQQVLEAVSSDWSITAVLRSFGS